MKFVETAVDAHEDNNVEKHGAALAQEQTDSEHHKSVIRKPEQLFSARQLEELYLCPITQCLMQDPVIAKVTLPLVDSSIVSCFSKEIY